MQPRGWGFQLWQDRVEESVANYIGEYEKGRAWIQPSRTLTCEVLADPGDYPSCDQQLQLKAGSCTRGQLSKEVALKKLALRTMVIKKGDKERW